jgi:hypothetical protein
VTGRPGRRGREDQLSRLNDLRGPGGRSREIRAVILQARAGGATAEQVDYFIQWAINVGMRGVQASLFD